MVSGSQPKYSKIFAKSGVPSFQVYIKSPHYSVSRPGYIYLFGENKDWNSSYDLKIYGKVRKFRAARCDALNFRAILKICF
jgi:hypothetical protein